MVVEGLSVEELDQTPVLWEYWPLMTEDREGAHKGLETKALRKPMPCSRSRECVFGMNSMSSLRMSSARMKEILGLAVTLWACALLISPITLSMSAVDVPYCGRTAGARRAGKPGSLRRSWWLGSRPGRALCPGRCRGTAACPGRRPRGR